MQNTIQCKSVIIIFLKSGVDACIALRESPASVAKTEATGLTVKNTVDQVKNLKRTANLHQHSSKLELFYGRQQPKT